VLAPSRAALPAASAGNRALARAVAQRPQAARILASLLIPAGNRAIARLVAARAPQRSLQRIGALGSVMVDPGIVIQALDEAANIVAWALPMQTAEQLRQARLDLTSAPEGQQMMVGTMTVTLDGRWRQRLLDRVRERTMERVAEVRGPIATRLAHAHASSDRLAVQAEMRIAARPFLDELRDPAQPSNRFEHPSAGVVAEVLAALTLDGEGQAEWELGHQGPGGRDAEARARAAAGLPQGAWCGAFAYTQQHTAGLSEHARAVLHSTGPHLGIDAFLDYERSAEHIWGETQWMPVRAYHEQRGSLRSLTRLGTGDVRDVDIQPGDIVLIDNAKGVFADHITQCRTYDASTGELVTIAGNEPNVKADTWDLTDNPAPVTVQPGQHKRSRVYAVGRFSIVDYETHVYLPSAPADLALSPEAMAAQRGGGDR